MPKTRTSRGSPDPASPKTAESMVGRRATINDIAASSLSPAAGWIVMLVLVAVYGGLTWRRDDRRRKSGLVAPPTGVTLLKIAGALAAGVALVLLCNTNRGVLVAIEGVPYVVLLVLAVVVIWTFLLERTRFGRYVYAIGGNAEAARRAGIGVANVRTAAFVLCSWLVGPAPPVAQLLDGQLALLLVGVGVTATLGQLCLTRAFTLGEPSRVSVVGLVQILFALGLDVLFADLRFNPTKLAGIGLVVAPTAWMMAARTES